MSKYMLGAESEHDSLRGVSRTYFLATTNEVRL